MINSDKTQVTTTNNARENPIVWEWKHLQFPIKNKFLYNFSYIKNCSYIGKIPHEVEIEHINRKEHRPKSDLVMFISWRDFPDDLVDEVC